jgi:hypothetical protein
MAAKFARRHYEVIAAVFKAQRPADSWVATARVHHNLLLEALMHALDNDNPDFKPERFKKAAGGFAYEADVHGGTRPLTKQPMEGNKV